MYLARPKGIIILGEHVPTAYVEETVRAFARQINKPAYTHSELYSHDTRMDYDEASAVVQGRLDEVIAREDFIVFGGVPATLDQARVIHEKVHVLSLYLLKDSEPLDHPTHGAECFRHLQKEMAYVLSDENIVHEIKTQHNSAVDARRIGELYAARRDNNKPY